MMRGYGIACGEWERSNASFFSSVRMYECDGKVNFLSG